MKNIISYIFHKTDPTSIVKYGREYQKSEDVQAYLDSLPEEARKVFENHIFSSAFFKRIRDNTTPLDLIKKRKGFWNKEKQAYEELEYFPEDYTIEQLDNLFPGWWTEEMRLFENMRLRTIRVEGYLCVPYPTKGGEVKITKRWAVGSARIEYEKDGKDASNPEYRYRAARTEWLKLAGKWFGIGLDIYHQRITPELKKMFEERVEPLGVYASELRDIANTLTTGAGLRDFIKKIPEPEITERFKEILNGIDPNLKNKEGENIHESLWKQYINHDCSTYKGRGKLEKFLQQVEKISLTLKQQKEKQNV